VVSIEIHHLETSAIKLAIVPSETTGGFCCQPSRTSREWMKDSGSANATGRRIKSTDSGLDLLAIAECRSNGA